MAFTAPAAFGQLVSPRMARASAIQPSSPSPSPSPSPTNPHRSARANLDMHGVFAPRATRGVRLSARRGHHAGGTGERARSLVDDLHSRRGAHALRRRAADGGEGGPDSSGSSGVDEVTEEEKGSGGLFPADATRADGEAVETVVGAEGVPPAVRRRRLNTSGRLRVLRALVFQRP